MRGVQEILLTYRFRRPTVPPVINPEEQHHAHFKEYVTVVSPSSLEAARGKDHPIHHLDGSQLDRSATVTSPTARTRAEASSPRRLQAPWTREHLPLYARADRSSYAPLRRHRREAGCDSSVRGSRSHEAARNRKLSAAAAAPHCALFSLDPVQGFFLFPPDRRARIPCTDGLTALSVR